MLNHDRVVRRAGLSLMFFGWFFSSYACGQWGWEGLHTQASKGKAGIGGVGGEGKPLKLG